MVGYHIPERKRPSPKPNYVHNHKQQPTNQKESRRPTSKSNSFTKDSGSREGRRDACTTTGKRISFRGTREPITTCQGTGQRRKRQNCSTRSSPLLLKSEKRDAALLKGLRRSEYSPCSTPLEYMVQRQCQRPWAMV